jgi:hypothetical protein
LKVPPTYFHPLIPYDCHTTVSFSVHPACIHLLLAMCRRFQIVVKCAKRATSFFIYPVQPDDIPAITFPPASNSLSISLQFHQFHVFSVKFVIFCSISVLWCRNCSPMQTNYAFHDVILHVRSP